MKMIMAVVPRDEVEAVLNALLAAGHTATFTESRGGMLRQAQDTLFIAVEADALKHVLTLIRENCHTQIMVDPSETDALRAPAQGESASVAARVGGAVVFVWDLERFEIY
jgi:uncharacterized protein YaaQ